MPKVTKKARDKKLRTSDTLINSQLRYHCATGECNET